MASNDQPTKAADAPQAVAPTAKERQAGVYSARNLQKALGALHQDGLVVLQGIIDKGHIDALNATMCEEASQRIADPKQAYNQNVKLTDPTHLHEDVYFNSFVLQIANAYLGPNPIWNWLTANTAIADTPGLRQAEHKDSSFDHPQCPYYLIANIPLCDFSVANGATEFWLGSSVYTSIEDQQVVHEDCTVSMKPYKAGERIPWISDEAKAARRSVRPPLQPAVARGDVLIRDLRTWHAGMPNLSTEHRVMLGLGYQSPIHPNYKQRLHLPLSTQDFFLGQAKGRVEVRANFYEDSEFAVTKADTYFDIRPQYGAEE
ncbi:phytanoyl-dioxygenase family protein [Coniella lustricola]|uniref:Phytanoyl-dioxygenase family protein n=1 Tax=Coniella lustricola TaxID=2025994 RepID=A0A2T3A8E1_9PEZI|nr:phytanoyl-dioxygenase family protein [Coniella lustricola]